MVKALTENSFMRRYSRGSPSFSSFHSWAYFSSDSGVPLMVRNTEEMATIMER